MALAGIYGVPHPVNEPVLAYAPGSPERAAVDAELSRQAAQPIDIPCVVGGRDVFTGDVIEVRNPAAHAEILARLHVATPSLVAEAIEAARAAKADWSRADWTERAAVLLRAAALLTGPRRAEINAATMLGQGKTVHQAEIDAVCELADFWRFNAQFARQVLEEQPIADAPGTWNRLDHRPLDGFVFAVAPFNFSSIALNLPTAPALMGNTVLWKPSVQSSVSTWHLFRLLRAAGLPDGVINLLNGHGPDVGDPVLASPELGGVHFTGSTRTFQAMWRTIGTGIERYRQYPRLVGETGGKDFIVVHESADPEQVAVAVLRGSFEYQGQKCSAASRIYVPSTLWSAIRDRIADGLAQIRTGDPRDAATFVGPVIDERAFDKIGGYVDLAHKDAEVVSGGTYDRSQGWFVTPTFARVDDPGHRLMREEVFGPVVAAYVYEPQLPWSDLLTLVDETSPYALTGAVFATDRRAIREALEQLRHAAGNFYINDKPTGAVVGQQPFGGSRASGTNDKAGSILNLIRWVSPRTIKETFDPPRDWRYPFLG